MNLKYSQRPYLLLAFFILGSMAAGISFSRLIYPFDTGHYEACIWTPALLSISGESPYGMATEPPYVMAPYGYLYYLTIGIGLKLFGNQLWFGRILSIFAFLICFLSIAYIAMRLTKKRQAVAMALIAFLSLFTVQAWMAIQRPDLPALALAFGAISLALQHTWIPSDKITIRSNLVILLLVSAFFFKQTIFLPLIVVVVLYVQRKWLKSAAYTLVGALSMGLLAAVLLNQTSAGGYFWQHFFLTRRIPHSYFTSIQVLAGIAKAPSTWICLAIITLAFSGFCKTGLAWKARWWRLSEPKAFFQIVKSPGNLFFLYLVAAVLLGFVTSSRGGSNINYYLEASIVASITMAIAWDWFTKDEARNEVHIFCVVLLTVAGAFQLARIGRGEYFRWQSLSYYREIVAILRDRTLQGATCISVYPELVTAAGREYHFGDWIQYGDGRSQELEKLFRHAVKFNKYSAIIWSSRDAGDTFAGYHLLQMKEPVPKRFYPVYLYIRDSQ